MRANFDITRRALPDVVIALPLNIYKFAIATVVSLPRNDKFYAGFARR